VYNYLWKTDRRAMERQLPYDSTECNLPLDTSKHASICQPQRDRRLSWPRCQLCTDMV